MKPILFIALLLAFTLQANAQWKPAGDNIKTQWAEKVDPSNTLPEYPRPIMVRNDWESLNGLWNYAIVPRSEQNVKVGDGKILVPFAVESSLSGVQKNVGKDNVLWYERTFTVPSSWQGRDVVLHFDAVDYEATVWVNGVKVGSHEGGYGHFSFNITKLLKDGEQSLRVRVWDPTDNGPEAIGKQRSKPEGIWYTPVTGIWQSVWLEPVNHSHFTSVVPQPDIDNNTLAFKTTVANANDDDIVRVTVKDGNNAITSSAIVGQDVELGISQPKLWTPDSPFLYDVTVELVSNGRVVDKVTSYAAMRKISEGNDANGVKRLMLNNKPVFQFGPLDQGYWPDGLYTAPTDEALKWDIEQAKAFGFNMIRKHMKVEPDRWYTWCDRLGVLVWQDMPSGDFQNGPQWQNRNYYNPTGRLETRSATSKQLFHKEWKEIMQQHMMYPSIVVWTPFNEAWGQFDTEEVTAFTRSIDPSRLINSASGGNHFTCGDILDLHNYPAPALYLVDNNRATVLGEYGGLGLPLKGHLWQKDRNWGYAEFKNSADVTKRYVELTDILIPMVRQSFAAAVYTQLTDVEGEVNGLITYDRKIIKLDKKQVHDANQKVIEQVK